MPQITRGRRWTGWRNRKASVLRPFPVLHCEELEARHAPAITYNWTGSTGDNLWATDGNWSGGVRPTGNAAFVEELVFPAISDAAKKATFNNLPSNSVFNSISFGDGGYTLSG